MLQDLEGLDSNAVFAGAAFASTLVGTILYGVIIVLFFQCTVTLFNPVNRKKGVRWGLVAHNVAVFSLATISEAMSLVGFSYLFIDVRDRYKPHEWSFVSQNMTFDYVLSTISSSTFQLIQWLIDGLLLYRCSVIYGMNYWVIAIPFLMYLTSLATGAIFIIDVFSDYFRVPWGFSLTWLAFRWDFQLTYYLISLSLNVLLTFMIAGRLILHNRSFQRVMGALPGMGGLYRTIVAALIESCALYTVSLSISIALERAGRTPAAVLVGESFFPLARAGQVISPLLLILRVANQATSKGSAAESEKISSIRFGSHGESMCDSGIIPDENSRRSVEINVEVPGVPTAGGEVAFGDAL